MSSEKVMMEFTIIGQETIGKATLQREFAPRTVALIRFRLKNPIQSRVVVREGEVAFPFKIGRVSPENAYKTLSRGDVAYWPQGTVLIVFLKQKTVSYPVNLVGRIDSGHMNFFDKLHIGTSIRIERIRPMINEVDYL
ncbi:MAG: cyclophilin-like family protein [Candidatus Thorarchaeota archaeon]